MQAASGSCGYSFPNNTVPTSGAYQGSIDANNSLIAGLPSAGCGSCILITCNRVGNQVQLPPPNDAALGVANRLQLHLSCFRLTNRYVMSVQAACLPNAEPVMLVITDSCLTCALNLPLEAFNQIADSYLGSVNVQGQLVRPPLLRQAACEGLEFPL